MKLSVPNELECNYLENSFKIRARVLAHAATPANIFITSLSRPAGVDDYLEQQPQV
ncbi:MAG TPA: hypothetical protein VHY08_24485 [Bacillota bacterium]|nr:hypothetical protein [Bacillota bacterium]